MVLQCNLFVQINLSTQYYTKKKISVPILTRSFSDTTQLVNKNRTPAFSMK